MEQQKEYVYFIKCNPNINRFANADCYVKIGKSHSIETIKNRFTALQTGNPFKLTLLGYVEGDEKYFHNYFSEFRINGEWFHYTFIQNKINNLNLKQLDKVYSEDDNIYIKQPYDFSHNWKNKNILKHLSTALRFMFRGYEVKLSTRRKGTVSDYFDNIINVGDYYYNIKDNPYQWDGIYLSLNSAYKIYCLFKNIVRLRNDNLSYESRSLQLKDSLNKIKQIWREDFEHCIFDEFKNNIIELKAKQ